MKSRLLASLAVSAVVVLGASGCSMISPQATTIAYSPAEGVAVPASGPVEVRNALLVADETGSSANFLAALINDTDESASIIIGVGGETQRVRVDAHSTVSLGVDGEDPLLFEGLDTHPGATLAVSFQSGDGTGVEREIPVLDGGLDYLEEYVPAESE